MLIPIGKTSSGDNAIYLDGYTKDGHTFSGNLLTVPEICKSLYSYGEYTDSQLNSGYHQASDYKNAIESYGRILKTMEFQEAHNQETLYEKAVEWIKNNYQGGVDTFSVKAIDLHFIGESSSKILLGDRVRIKYPVGTTTTNSRIVERTLTCTSVTYDLYNPENNQYTFGIPANMLGKTYGDNSQKQTKRSTSYKPPETTDPDVPEESWDSQVIKWLETHKIWKKSVPGSGSRGAGPTVVYSDGTKTFGYFLETVLTMTSDGRVQRRLWAPIIQGVHTKPDKPSEYEYVWQRDANNRPQGTNVIKPSEEITMTVVDSRKLFDYIKDEWGIDLKNGGLSVNKPSVYTTDDGNVEITVPGITDITIGTIINPETGQVDTEGIKAIFSSALPGQDIEIKTDKYGNTGYYKVTPDGRTVMVTIDPVNGDFQYIDPATGQPTNIRSLHLETVSNSNFIGSMVTQDYADADGTIHIYKFGQGIERWAGGEMVVAYVDGDIVKIGSRDRTKKIYITGEQIILGDADSETTIIDTLRRAGVIDNNLEPNALVASAVYSQKIGSIEGRIHTLETTYITSDYLLAKHTIHAGTLSAQHFYVDTGIDSEMGSYDLRNCVASINVTRSNNEYTIHLYKSTGGEITLPSGYNATFSRAITSWDAGWSNGVYTVKAMPQNQSVTTQLRAVLPVQGSSINVNGKVVSRQFDIKYGPDDEHLYNTGFVSTIAIDASTVYTNGANSVSIDASPTWSKSSGNTDDNNTISYTTTGRPTSITRSTYLCLTQQSSFSSHKKYVYIRSGSTQGNTWARIQVDATSEYNAGKAAGISSLTSDDIDLNSWLFDTGKPSEVGTYTQLNGISTLVANYRRGYVYFKVQIEGSSAYKWYRFTLPD